MAQTCGGKQSQLASNSERVNSGRGDFFQSKVTVFVGHFPKSAEIGVIRGRLEALPFKIDVVECDDSSELTIYHRGDVISGARVSHFLEYAVWLNNR